MTTAPTWDLLCAGDLFVDLVLSGFPAWPRPGEESYARSMVREVGGGCAITAAGAARLGLRAGVLAAVGAEEAVWIAGRLGQLGVDASPLQRHPREPTALTVSVSTAEDRAFFSYAGANQDLPRLLRDAAARALLRQTRHLHLACAPEPELLVELCRELHAAGGAVSLDVGWHEEWLADAESWRALAAVDLFFPNRVEARRLVATLGESASVRELAEVQGADEAVTLLRALERAGLRAVALKLGAEGAALLWQGQVLHAAAHPVTARDTTGAGDAFDAGFLGGWLRGEAPAACLRRGAICGALSTRALGGLSGLPTLAEVDEVKRRAAGGEGEAEASDRGADR